MRDDRHLVGRLDHFSGRRHCGINVAVVTRFRAFLVEGIEIRLAELRAVGGARSADLPLDRQRIERGLRAEVTVGHDCDRVVELDHLKDAAAGGDRAFVDRFHRAAEHRAFNDRSPHHARHVQIDAVFR